MMKKPKPKPPVKRPCDCWLNVGSCFCNQNKRDMRSEFAQWLDDMQHIADAENITVAARHFDVLDFYFKSKKSPEQAFLDYRDNFLPRWNAITENGKHTEPT